MINIKHLLTATIALTMVAAWAKAGDVITDVQGDPSYYKRTSLGFYIYAGAANVQFGPIPGTSKIIWSTDEENVAYIYNPLTADARDTYIKCTVDGDKLTARFPQVLAMIEDLSGPMPLYIGKMVNITDENGDTYIPTDNADDNVYTWTMHPDGTVTLDHDPVAMNGAGNAFADGMPHDILGTYYYQPGLDGTPEAIWNGVGDWAQTYEPVEVEPITPMPGDLETEQWKLTSKKITRMVDVAIDETTGEIFIGRLTPYGDGALVGRIDDDKAVFPTLQNLGFNFKTNANVYFVATTAVYGSYDFGDYVMTYLEHFEWKDEMVLAFDRVNKTMKPVNENECILINAFRNEVNHYEYIEEPCFTYLPPEGMNANPLNPVITVPGVYQGFDNGYHLEFDLPTTNINGVALNTDRMYYNIYLNGEMMTFYPDQYLYLAEEVTDIPYGLTDRDHDFSLRGTTHMLQLHHEGIHEIGIRSCFVGFDGTVYCSEIVTCETATNAAVPGLGATVVDERYYDIYGRELPEPRQGLVIKRTEYSDGTVTTKKLKIGK